MEELASGDQLLKLFGDIEASGYVDPVHLRDTKAGFSVQRCYPENIRYKPARNSDGVDDNVAVIWVVYEDGKPQGNNLIPIRLRIAMMSKYRAIHWDYDFDDKKCPTKESVLESKKSIQPLDLSLSNEFFYDKENHCIINSSNEVVTGTQVLDAMFNEHCDTVHPLKGLRHRSKKKFDDLVKSALDRMIDLQIWVLKHIFSRTLQEHRDRSSFLDGYRPEDLRKSKTESITLAGYSASKSTIFLYCSLVVILCIFVLPAKEDTYVGTLVRSEFLMFVHTLFSLVILDDFLPKLVFIKMNFLIRVRKWNFNRLLKISV